MFFVGFFTFVCVCGGAIVEHLPASTVGFCFVFLYQICLSQLPRLPRTPPHTPHPVSLLRSDPSFLGRLARAFLVSLKGNPKSCCLACDLSQNSQVSCPRCHPKVGRHCPALPAIRLPRATPQVWGPGRGEAGPSRKDVALRGNQRTWVLSLGFVPF